MTEDTDVHRTWVSCPGCVFQPRVSDRSRQGTRALHSCSIHCYMTAPTMPPASSWPSRVSHMWPLCFSRRAHPWDGIFHRMLCPSPSSQLRQCCCREVTLVGQMVTRTLWTVGRMVPSRIPFGSRHVAVSSSSERLIACSSSLIISRAAFSVSCKWGCLHRVWFLSWVRLKISGKHTNSLRV